MKKLTIYILLLLPLLFSSCREDDLEVFNPNQQTDFNDWSDVFESYWNAMNYSYAFWDVDPTDWDKVYMDYKPQFNGLEFGSKEDSVRVTELFSEITSTLVDHHYAFALKNPDGSPFYFTRPGNNEVMKRDYYHEPLGEQDMIDALSAHRESGRFTEFTGATYGSMVVYTFLIENNIVYLHLNSFDLTDALVLNKDESIDKTIKAYHKLLAETPNIKGVIIDTRSNTGGYLNDMHFILEPLLSEPVLFGYGRSKIGLGRLDYTPWAPYILDPLSEDENPVKRDFSHIPIVALADIHSISMGEMTPWAISEMPNGTIIGERTFGGLGPLNSDFNSFYAGTVENKAYLMYTSTMVSKCLDGKCYEGIGISPDIEALFNETEFKNGNDTQLERAIEFVKTGK